MEYMGKITYWFYYNGQPIASVRVPVGTSPAEARRKAIRRHQAIPLCYPEAPYRHEAKLRRAEIKLDERG